MTYKIVRVQRLKTAVFIWTGKHECHVFPGHCARLIHQRAWDYWNAADGIGFFDHSGENEKRGIEGIPFFSKKFRWKSTFHLIYHRNNRFFHTKGKRPRKHTLHKMKCFSGIYASLRRVLVDLLNRKSHCMVIIAILLISSGETSANRDIREFTQTRRRRQRERHLKI